MRVQKTSKRFFVVTFCLAIISLTFSFTTIQSQTKPLTLAQVLTGLQSKSGGYTISQKNSFITKRVRIAGVTFRLTTELERELRSAGASTTLIRAIRLKSPRTRPTPRPSNVPDENKPTAKYDKIWLEQNVTEKGVRGIRLFANFTVYNLKGIKSDIVFRFQKDGKWVKGNNSTYSTTGGQVSARRYLSPSYSATVFEELDAFLPYSAFTLPPGVHNLKLDTDVILRDGTQVKHLALQNIRLVIPAKRPPIRKTGSATLGRIWVDYGVKENGTTGMRVHVKATVRDMKDQSAYLQVLFTKEDGTKLYARTQTYKSKHGDGQTAAYRRIKPIFSAANFNDISVFVPYSEFSLPVGKYNLKLHADLVYSDYSQLQHLDYKPFTYTKRR